VTPASLSTTRHISTSPHRHRTPRLPLLVSLLIRPSFNASSSANRPRPAYCRALTFHSFSLFPLITGPGQLWPVFSLAFMTPSDPLATPSTSRRRPVRGSENNTSRSPLPVHSQARSPSRDAARVLFLFPPFELSRGRTVCDKVRMTEGHGLTVRNRFPSR